MNKYICFDSNIKVIMNARHKSPKDLISVLPSYGEGHPQQTRSQDQFWGCAGPPKCGPCGPKKWKFRTSTPFKTLLQKPHFWPLCGKKWTFWQIWGGALHPFLTPWLQAFPQTKIYGVLSQNHQFLLNELCDYLEESCLRN